MIIYIDILLVLNGWLDFLLLLGVRRFSGGDARPWRLALGALLGAAFSLTLLLPPLSLPVSLVLKLAAAAVMVLVAFRWQGWRFFGRRMVLLFSLSAGLAGLCGALYFFAAPTGFYVYNGVVYYSVPPLLLVGLTVVCYGVLWAGERLMQRRAPAQHRWQVRLTVGENRAEFLCLYDSGNHLVEPFSGLPVLVLERAVAQRLLPVPESVAELPAGWRVIPFQSIGGSGVLPAFLPDLCERLTPTGSVDLGRCYVAVCDKLSRGEYQGLVGSEMGDKSAERGVKELCFTD